MTIATENTIEPQAAATAPLTIAGVLARMVPTPPTADDLERLRVEAEAARTAARQAADRVKRLTAEIEAARTTAQPRPDLAQTMAALTAKEIEARVKGLPMPKGHAERVAEARAAIAAAEARRMEAELTLPALESLQAEIKAEATRASNAETRACSTYGSAAMLHTISTRYLPALAEALQIEHELVQIEDTWGGNISFGVQFQNPITGARWTRVDLQDVADKVVA